MCKYIYKKTDIIFVQNKNYKDLISRLLVNKKLVALDVGAQGGFNNNIFLKKYDNFFNPIMVEPLIDEAQKLI